MIGGELHPFKISRREISNLLDFGSETWPQLGPIWIFQKFVVFREILDFVMLFGGRVLGDAGSDSESQRRNVSMHPKEHRI